MKKLTATIGALVMASLGAVHAQHTEPVTATVDNFTRSEIDITMAADVKMGALGKWP